MPGGTTLANAYVQILPTTKGIKGNLEKELGGVGDSAGEKAGSRFTGAFRKMAAAGAVATGAALTKSLMEGANLEQSLGGVETLFGGKNAPAVREVIKNADAAWKTAGLSADAYMSQATSSAAALLKSLGGDTKAAAKYTDMAITDMSDNVNKFGSNIEDVQNAYRGFAKQNYTMLDNLSLGYAGTKTGMEELLADAEKLSGQKYDIGNLNDVYDAIHVMQKELGVTGTTAKEAEKTLSGSFAAMKGAAENLLGNLSVRPELVGQSMRDLAGAADTFLFKNLVPAVGNVIKALPVAIKTFMSQGIPQLMQSGKTLLDSILKGMSGNLDIGAKIMPMLAGLSRQILKASGGMVDAGISILTKLAQGIAKALPALIKYGPKIITNLANVINKNAPKILKGGAKIILILAKGIIKSIPVLIKNIPKIFKAFMAAWEAVNWLNLGKIAMTGIKKGITSLTKNLSEPVRKAFTKVKDAILAPSNAAKSALGTIVNAIKGKINFSGIIGKVKTAFTNVKTTITAPFTKAKEALSKVIGKIKGLFPFKLGKLFSGIKLPSIYATKGKAPWGILGKGTPPKFGIKWNAKAEDNPYMFSGATVFGAGETTDEILYGKRSLMDDITTAVKAAGQSESAGTSGGTVKLVINLDSKTIGQATVNYLNGQTLMFGTNPVLV